MKDKFKNILKDQKPLLIVAIAIIIVVIIAIIYANSNDKGIETISESSLREIIMVSDLSVLEYTYNSYATIYKENKNGEIEKKDKNIMCYVAYKGTVKAGFDFSKLDLNVNNKSKKIKIKLPKIELTSVNVDTESLDSIFVKEKYDNEKIFSRLLKTCEEDLITKAETSVNLLDMAQDNAKASLKAVLKPWEQQGYAIEIV